MFLAFKQECKVNQIVIDVCWSILLHSHQCSADDSILRLKDIYSDGLVE
jgi:hypothetical protein